MRTSLPARALLALLLATPALAAPPPGPPQFHMEPTARPTEAPAEYPLYSGVAPGSEQARQTESWARLSTPDGSSGAIVRNVTRPTFSVFPADPPKATGAAVILAPGGAFLSLSMETEGWLAAKWLAAHGITAFVLKYRLDETPVDVGAFMGVVAQRMGGAASRGAAGAPPISQPLAIDDGKAMVRLVRARAAEWKINPHRIGLVGFSAGAMVALSVTLDHDSASRPDFSGIIYGPMNPVTVPADGPPMFVALAQDDPLFGKMGFGLVQSWQRAGKPIEFHFYEGGDHGFGMRHLGTTSDHWIDEFGWWLQAQGLLGAGGAR